MFERLVVGLGNEGKKYEGTRHNVGFEAVDALASHLGVSFAKSAFQGTVATAGTVMLAKPHTFMNNSGSFVRELASYYKIPVSSILVVYDDMDLPVGELRLRDAGSSGGQRGIQSVIEHLATEGVNRLRLGIGRPETVGDAVNHVLSPFSKDQRKSIDIAIKDAVKVAQAYAEGGFEAANVVFLGLRSAQGKKSPKV